jgi:transposase
VFGEKIEKLHRRTFTVEFKVEAVKLKREQALTYAEVGRRLNVSPRLLRHWEKQYDAGELTPEQAKRRISPESQEISELRAQVSRLKMENAILKNLSRGGPLLREEKLSRIRYPWAVEESGRWLFGGPPR